MILDIKYSNDTNCYIFFLTETKEEQRESIKSIDCNYKFNQYWWNWADEAGRKGYVCATAANIANLQCVWDRLGSRSTFYTPMCNALPLTRCDRLNGVINAHALRIVESSGDRDTRIRCSFDSLPDRYIRLWRIEGYARTDVTRRFAAISDGGGFFFVFFRTREESLIARPARDIALLPAICAGVSTNKNRRPRPSDRPHVYC